MTTAVQKAPKLEGGLSRRGIEFRSLGELKVYADLISGTQFAPAEYRGRPVDALIAMAYGMEIGLSPHQALQNVKVINGKPSVYGDGMTALVLGSGLMDGLPQDQWKMHPKYGLTCIVTVKRKGSPTTLSRSFSIYEAKQAGLWGKGTWLKYPNRMIYWRALGYAYRDAFGDVLKGMITAEEAMDYPSERERMAEATVKEVQLADVFGDDDEHEADNGSKLKPTPPTQPAEAANEYPEDLNDVPVDFQPIATPDDKWIDPDSVPPDDHETHSRLHEEATRARQAEILEPDGPTREEAIEEITNIVNELRSQGRRIRVNPELENWPDSAVLKERDRYRKIWKDSLEKK